MTIMPAVLSRYWLTMFFRSRLCRCVALGVFLSILIVEAVILVPSVFNYKRDLLEALDRSGRYATRAALGVMTDESPENVLKMTLGHTVLTGADLFDGNGARIGSFGEPPVTGITRIGPESLTGAQMVSSDRAEAVWHIEGIRQEIYVLARLDASGIGDEILAFIVRITFLVLGISVVVTATTMVVLGATVINPLLTLHGRIRLAGEDPRHPEKYQIDSTVANELGEVMLAFNSLVRRVRDNLFAAEDANAKLDDANRGLEQKVQERTKALSAEVDRRRAAEERVKFEAYHDSVTLLPNRSKFIDMLSEIIKCRSGSGYRGCAVFSVLLDRVKMINHSLGVRSGDKLVKEVALRLRDSIGKKGYLARLDAETFAVSMEGVCDQTAAESIVLVIKKAMERPFVIDGQEVYITLSFGVAFSTDCIERADEILQSSGLALATARSKGFNSLVFFEDAYRSGAQARLKLENDLRRAIRDGTQLQMFFQPVMTLSGNRVAGFESLMRWNHPDRGLVSPGVFIPIAEESDLVVPMGSWALRHSAGQLAEWHKGCGPDLFISVNVSGRQLYADDLVQVVKDVLSDSGIPPKSLKLEITETVLMDEPEFAIKVLNDIRDLGVRLGIDDFGTGYSSLSYLQRLPADVLKIDRAFIQNMADSPDDQQIVKTIADLGHNLGMELIAEGIERENEVPLLRQYGCDLTQGFFFARPMPAGEAGAFLRKTNMT